MNIVQLKAMAYDRLVQIEALQRDLVGINQQIAKQMEEERKQPKPEVSNDKDNGK